MKRYIYLFSIVFLNLSVNAQKQDYIWLMGNDQSLDSLVQGFQFNFNNEPFSVELREGVLAFDQNNASICTPDGQLLFYTNGCAISNREHELMVNGDSINEGIFFDELWLGNCEFGYPGRQDIIALPDPGYEHGYYILHKTIEYEPNEYPPVFSKFLKYTYIDLFQDNGLGAVSEKNIVFYESRFMTSYLSAIGHENQTDFWIIQPEANTNCFHKFLLTTSGLEYIDKQCIGVTTDEIWGGGAGDGKFSPDGTMYVYYNAYDGMQLFDFDRETGEFSNGRFYLPPRPETTTFASVEFSPDSKLLYTMHTDSLWQFDLEADGAIEDSKILIDVWNGVEDPTPTTFFVSTLGPDCRIYIRSGGGTKSLHVINKPNNRGMDCDFVQQGILLPQFDGAESWPNFPRWRVDEEEKCDPSISSLFGELVYYRRELSVYPNPVRDYININLPEDNTKGTLRVLSLKSEVLDIREVVTEVKLDMTDYSAGAYIIEYLPEDNPERLIYSTKIVVSK
jgi:hypothetical protein